MSNEQKIEIKVPQSAWSKEKTQQLSQIVTNLIQNRYDELSAYFAIFARKQFQNLNHVHNSITKDQNKNNNDDPLKSIWDKEIEKLADPSVTDWISCYFSEHFLPKLKSKQINLTLNEDSVVSSLGSCFATNIANHLSSIGVKKVHSIRIEEIVNSPRLLDQYFSGKLNSDKSSELFSVNADNASGLIENIDIMILTFGVAFNLVDKNGSYLDDNQLAKKYLMKGEASFQLSSVEDNKTHIKSIVRNMKKINPNMEIFVSLSPVPLSGFWGTDDVFKANTLSKATLALAIAEASKEADFTYFPSYEVIAVLAPIINNASSFGEDGTTRHPKNQIVKSICEAFVSSIDR